MARRVRVPAQGAGSSAIVKFAHTYNGYELHGGLDALAEITQSVREHWQQTRELGEDVDALRACLFFEARAHRQGGYGPFDEEPFVAALMARIRSLAGELVPPRGTVT